MSSTGDPTAALIVHKQNEFTRQFSQPRSTVFASTVANRFYSDNSLNRQRQVVECTKRRQARAREKALEQEQAVALLHQQYEHKCRLRELQNQRETSRMTRKLQHVAAAYLQYVFRRFVQRQRVWHQRARARQFIADFCGYQWRRRVILTSRACCRIQRQWRAFQSKRLILSHRRILQRFLRSVVWARRRTRSQAAVRIQRWFFTCRWRRRSQAAKIIQRRWAAYRFWRHVVHVATDHRQQRRQGIQEASVRVLQYAVGRFTVRRRLLRTSTFARLPSRRSLDSRRSLNAWIQQRHVLSDVVAEAKRLQAEELKLRIELDDLMTRVTESRTRLADERERRRRLELWADLRRVKDDEHLREQLREWESRKRFEIRIELEREVELERRAQLRVAASAFGNARRPAG